MVLVFLIFPRAQGLGTRNPRFCFEPAAFPYLGFDITVETGHLLDCRTVPASKSDPTAYPLGNLSKTVQPFPPYRTGNDSRPRHGPRTSSENITRPSMKLIPSLSTDRIPKSYSHSKTLKPPPRTS